MRRVLLITFAILALFSLKMVMPSVSLADYSCDFSTPIQIGVGSAVTTAYSHMTCQYTSATPVMFLTPPDVSINNFPPVATPSSALASTSGTVNFSPELTTAVHNALTGTLLVDVLVIFVLFWFLGKSVLK